MYEDYLRHLCQSFGGEMKQVFQELLMFLLDNSDTFVYEGQFDEDSLKSLVLGFAEEFESRVH